MSGTGPDAKGVLAGAVAVVTGAGSGLGRAIALKFAEHGARLALLDIREEPLAQTHAQLAAAARPAARCYVGDVSDEQWVVRTVGQIRSDLGRSTLLANSAGLTAPATFLNMTAELLDRIYEVNVIGTFLMGREVSRLMAGHGGRIINISSVCAERAFPTRAAYCASKAAVKNLTEIMAVELGPAGITVNAIAPGPIDTPMARGNHPQAIVDKWHSVIPLGRYGLPEEIADAALFLARPDASFVNGHSLRVDGGFSSAGFLADGGNLRAFTYADHQ